MDKEMFHLPSTPCTKLHRRIFDYALGVYEYFEDRACKAARTGKLKTPTPFEWFFLTSLSQIQMTYISILNLCAIGHISDCMVLLRNIYEYLFHIEYMYTDPDALGKQWEAYDSVFQVRNAQRFMKSPQFANSKSEVTDLLERLNQENREHLDLFTKRKNQLKCNIEDRKYFLNWTKETKISQIAEKGGMSRDYETVYERCCDFVHPSRESADRYVHVNSEGELTGFGPKPTCEQREVSGLIVTLACSLLHAAVLISRYFAIDLTDRHSDLADIGSLLLSSDPES